MININVSHQRYVMDVLEKMNDVDCFDSFSVDRDGERGGWTVRFQSDADTPCITFWQTLAACFPDGTAWWTE